jgi:hypothetical protein
MEAAMEDPGRRRHRAVHLLAIQRRLPRAHRLELKGLAWEARPVHLVRDGGEQHLDAYRALNRSSWCRPCCMTGMR